MDKKYSRFLVVWAANSLVVFLANWLYPTNVVLGTYRINLLFAVVLGGLLITVLSRLARIFLKKYVQQYLKGKLGMFVFYGLINTASIWLIARAAPATGLGISSFFWALVLGFSLSVSQWLTRQGLKTFKLQ